MPTMIMTMTGKTTVKPSTITTSLLYRQQSFLCLEVLLLFMCYSSHVHGFTASSALTSAVSVNKQWQNLYKSGQNYKTSSIATLSRQLKEKHYHNLLFSNRRKGYNSFIHNCRYSTSFVTFSSLSDNDNNIDDPSLFSSVSSTQQQQQQQEEQQQDESVIPQVFASGYSTNTDLILALEEALDNAMKGFPKSTTTTTTTIASIDLCLVSVSSLYDSGIHSPALVVTPTLIETAAQKYNYKVRNIIGSSVSGCISCSTNSINDKNDKSSSSDTTTTTTTANNPSNSITPRELEGFMPSVSVTLALLPDVQVKSFYCDDVPDDVRDIPAWKKSIGIDIDNDNNSKDDTNTVDQPIIWLIPSPAFAARLPDLISALQNSFDYKSPPIIFGGMASTVSSLSRAKLYRNSDAAATNGCVGVILKGDIKVETLVAQGAKPVGNVYQILKCMQSTIHVIVTDQVATEQLKEQVDEINDDDDESDNEDSDSESEAPTDYSDRRAMQYKAYQQAIVPKPVLAEANFLMRTLSDDDQAFMRRQLLVGLEQQSVSGSTAGATIVSELQRLALGKGRLYSVYVVASGSMKDGSVTLPLNSVNVVPGMRMRFFVREPEFAKREIDALWLGYKKRQLGAQFASKSNNENDRPSSPSSSLSEPTACLILPTLDRGSKFFNGKPGYESGAVARMLPNLQCIMGYFTNSIIGRVDVDDNRVGVQGSASSYTLFSSKSGRPLYSPAAAAAREKALQEQKAIEEEQERQQQVEDQKREARLKEPLSELAIKAPRTEDGELILKRREVHSGRAMTVSRVEWSVAEKTATPTSLLEGFMWDKETEVDRQRERVPLANLVSQCRLSMSDPKSPKPRAFISPIKQAAAENRFVIIPECKRSDPAIGSLRKRYDINKLSKDFTKAGAAAISVNCDGVLFGGTLEDITKARSAASSAVLEQVSEEGVVAPPILASDLILYPYQLYKLRLAGADAVNLIGAALATKDLLYLIKIAASLQLQALVTVTSKVQIAALQVIPSNTLNGIIVSNRNLEDYSHDLTGTQALSLLNSQELKDLRSKQDGLLILAEGRVGFIEENSDKKNITYVQQLKEAGAVGAIVGGSLAKNEAFPLFL